MNGPRAGFAFRWITRLAATQEPSRDGFISHADIQRDLRLAITTHFGDGAAKALKIRMRGESFDDDLVLELEGHFHRTFGSKGSGRAPFADIGAVILGLRREGAITKPSARINVL